MRLVVLTLQLFWALCPYESYGQITTPSPTPWPPLPPPPPHPPVSHFPRQAPWCVTDRTESDLKNFKEIFEKFNKNTTKFVPVSPNTEQSPTGFVRNVSLSRIHIIAVAENLPAEHRYRKFHNYFHISINSVAGSGGFEGLYVQSIGAPIGVPFGEFVTDFDCGDCSIATSELENITSIIPCQFVPAAAFLQPTVLSIGGTVDVNNPVKFKEAHFHFRYVDYPCYDVTFAQFLIIAVRRWAPPIQYEVFYSPVYKVNIEAVGAPYPMYYGWKANDILCHHAKLTGMDNWKPQQNQRAKLKYSAEYDNCTYTENKAKELGPGNVCKPGPVTCGIWDHKDTSYTPRSGGEWIAFRERYSSQKHPNGTQYICFDCGEWEENIGKPTWPQPPVVSVIEEINIAEVYITFAPIHLNQNNDSCEERDRYAKNQNNSRVGEIYCQTGNFDDDLAYKGFNFGKTLLTAHSVLMVFSFTVGSNCLIYCARFLKEASFAEKGSGCFGVGKWLWEHIFFTYLCFASILFGAFLVGFTETIDVCKIYDDHSTTESCQEGDLLHRLIGSVAVFLFIMGFVSGWVRPKNKVLRLIVIWYHAISGYLAKYIGLINIATAPIYLDVGGILFLVMTEVTFLVFYAAATFVNYKMDQQMKFRVRERKWMPVPEGIDTFSEPPLKNLRALLFPCFIVCETLWFALLVLFEYHDVRKAEEIEDII